jgi:hypothetical protein
LSEADAVVLLNDLAAPFGPLPFARYVTRLLDSANASHRITSLVLLSTMASLADDMVRLDPLAERESSECEHIVGQFAKHAG